MSYSTYSDIQITDAQVNAKAVHTAVAGDRLVGTVLENKQVFDAYPDLIKVHFNDLWDYLNGDAGLDYNATEITFITGVLDCTEADITK